MNTTKITIQTSVSTNRQKTWDYYTIPTHITNWNFATDEWQCPSASNDLRVGGKYNARMEAKDGSFGFDFEAVYTKIDAGKSFTYILTDSREVQVVFTELRDITSVLITFDAESENSIEMQQNGWQSILNNFKKYVESN